MARVIEMVPNHRIALNATSGTYHALGRDEEAVRTASRFLAAAGLPEAAEVLTSSFAEVDYREAYSRVADTVGAIAKERFVAPFTVARVYLVAGRYDEALDWLERSVASREPNSPYLAILPEVDPLTDTPRFQALLEEMGSGSP